MTCTVLIENSVRSPNLVSQHGLSLYIENAGCVLLLDSGQDAAFAENAAALGKNLSTVDVAVCSHAHYDHAGGFNTFCALNDSAPIYTYWHPGTVYYSTSHCTGGEPARFIGFSIVPVYEKRLRVSRTDSPQPVADGCWIVPVVLHPSALPYKNRLLFIRKNGRLERDTFDHECVLVIKTVQNGRSGLALFNSCSHNGVINSIESVKHFFPGQPVFSYSGGFHFPWDSGEAIAAEDCAAMDALAAYVRSDDIRLYSGHCTGDAAFAYLEKRCGGLLQRLYTGMTYTV
jgi:7,8-dihydropterin-6-yl-methyl-4-(beta-D-ribofuranosyl)aminobenzene 5'-phosphate synthase